MGPLTSVGYRLLWGCRKWAAKHFSDGHKFSVRADQAPASLREAGECSAGATTWLGNNVSCLVVGTFACSETYNFILSSPANVN